MGGSQLPLHRVHCLSGKHPGSMPGRGREDGRRSEIRHIRKKAQRKGV